MRHADSQARSPMSGWASVAGPKSRTRRHRLGRRLGSILLLLPLLVGVIGAPGATTSVQGDELSEARARQARIKKDVAAQRAQVARLQQLQANLSDDIQDTASEIRGLNADAGALGKKIVKITGQIAAVQAEYESLVDQLAGLDAELVDLQTREGAKRAEMSQRRALLAERIRSAYDSDRTSLLESI